MAKKKVNSAAIKRALKIGALTAVLGGGGIIAHDQLTNDGRATDALGKSVGDTVDQVTGKTANEELKARQQRAFKNYVDTHKQTTEDINKIKQENEGNILGKAVNSMKKQGEQLLYNFKHPK
jgi:hypothetical protein